MTGKDIELTIQRKYSSSQGDHTLSHATPPLAFRNSKFNYASPNTFMTWVSTILRSDIRTLSNHLRNSSMFLNHCGGRSTHQRAQLRFTSPGWAHFNQIDICISKRTQLPRDKLRIRARKIPKKITHHAQILDAATAWMHRYLLCLHASINLVTASSITWTKLSHSLWI